MKIAGTILVTVLLTALAAGAVAAEATVADGDRVRGTLAEGGGDRLTVFVPAPASLDVRLRLDRNLRVALRVFGPDGAEVDADAYLRGALSRKPSLRHVPLLQAGSYRIVIEQDAGAGSYEAQLRLGAHSARVIDLATPSPADSAVRLDAAEVAYRGNGTAIDAADVQGALDELDAAVGAVREELAETSGDVSAYATAVDGLAADVAAGADARAELAADLAALAARTTALETPDPNEAASSPLAVLWELPSTQTVEAEAYVLLPGVQNDDAFRIYRHSVRSHTFAAGEIRHVVIARVHFTYRPTFKPGVEPNRGIRPLDQIVWAEVGGREIAFVSAGAEQDLYDYRDGVLGLAGTDQQYTPERTYRELVYFPTASERSDGFSMEIRYSALAFADRIEGFSVDIDNAIIVGG